MLQKTIWEVADDLKDKADMNRLTKYGPVEQAKQQGIELAYHHSDNDWKRAAKEQLFKVIKTNDEFTSDEIIMPLEARGIFTHDNRAIAAILLAAKRLGLIEPTGTQVKCKRPKRHNGWVALWRTVRRPA